MNRSMIIVLALAACDSPGGRGSADAVATTDAVGASDTTMDATSTDATDVATTATTDATTTATTDVVTSTDVADAAPDTVAPSAEHPSVGCNSDRDCDSDQACCTNANVFLSECIAADDCDGGAHDACVTDQQCQARRPGEWTICCHDRGSRNYCAPSIETCQPLVACETPGDCAGNGVEVCCSPHRYYGTSLCTSEFFANPTTDCPAN